MKSQAEQQNQHFSGFTGSHYPDVKGEKVGLQFRQIRLELLNVCVCVGRGGRWVSYLRSLPQFPPPWSSYHQGTCFPVPWMLEEDES